MFTKRNSHQSHQETLGKKTSILGKNPPKNEDCSPNKTVIPQKHPKTIRVSRKLLEIRRPYLGNWSLNAAHIWGCPSCALSPRASASLGPALGRLSAAEYRCDLVAKVGKTWETTTHWIGLRDNLQEDPDICYFSNSKNHGFRLRCSLKPIQ